MKRNVLIPVGLIISLAAVMAITYVGCGGSSSSSDSGSSAAYEALGITDTAFGNLGVVTTTIGSDSIAMSLALQSDGRIVAGGYTNDGFYDAAVIGRYNPNGTLDTGFGIGGVVTTTIGTSSSIQDTIIQSDGKILVAGYADSGSGNDFLLARYTISGTLDTSFGGGDGVITTTIYTTDYILDAALQADNKIVVAGQCYSGTNGYFALARYTTAGALDDTFGISGVVTTTINTYNSFEGMALQADGKIVAAGRSSDGLVSCFALARYTISGTLDTTFSADGVVTTTVFPGSSEEAATSVAIQPDGKILVGGLTFNDGAGEYYAALCRYTSVGALDTSFSADGVVTLTMPSYTTISTLGLSLQSNNKIILTGYAWDSSYHFMLLRYNTDGALDTTFGGNDGIVLDLFGGVNAASYAHAIQPDGRIVLGGMISYGSDAHFAVARFK